MPSSQPEGIRKRKKDLTDEHKEVSAMPRRKPEAPKEGPVWKLSAVEATLQAKPHYNGFACGHGAHGDSKYNRAKERAQFLTQMEGDW